MLFDIQAIKLNKLPKNTKSLFKYDDMYLTLYEISI